MNVGEELVAAYLQHIKGCDFIQQNLYPPGVQGEIDVVGINLSKPSVYICEVAIHLVTGLQYVKNNQPNNVGKLVDKFSKDIEYGRQYFQHHEQHYMLWSPVVRRSKSEAAYSQERDLEELQAEIQRRYGVEIECVVNEDFQRRIEELREYARKRTEELKNPVLRLLQIEEALKKHLDKRAKGSL